MINISPVGEAEIGRFHNSNREPYAGPAAHRPGDIFGDTNNMSLLPDRSKSSGIWRSREGGMLHADSEEGVENKTEVLWALKDHVRTTVKCTAFSAEEVISASRQNSKLVEILQILKNFSPSNTGVASRLIFLPVFGRSSPVGDDDTSPDCDWASPVHIHDSARGKRNSASSAHIHISAGGFPADGHSPEQLEAFAILTASRQGNHLHACFIRNLKVVYDDRTDFWRLFCSAQPFTAALTTKFFRVLLLVLGIMTLFSLPLSVMFSPITTIGQFHLREFRSLRFTAKELRSGDSWPEIRSSGLTRFGVLYRNCSVSEESVSQSDGATEYLHFADKVAFDGWFLVTGRGAATSDAVKFVLEGSNDNTTWTTVAISSECGSWSADKPAPEHHILPVFPMPTARERVVRFNFLRNECLFPDVIYVITQWIMTLVLICASLAAFMGAYREAPKHITGIGCESASVFNIYA